MATIRTGKRSAGANAALVYSARRSYDCDLLGTFPTKPGLSPVQSLEELFNDCVQAIYGASQAPRAARHWFLIGATCLLEVFDRMAEELHAGELPDETMSEMLTQLRQHLRGCSRLSAASDTSPLDWGP